MPGVAGRVASDVFAFAPGAQAGPVSATGSVMVPPATARFGVISDLDDTVISTSLPRLFIAAWNSFFRTEAARQANFTNEVGAGIVPENRLSRIFRDAAGTLNQQVAQVADEVILAVCGLPMKVK